MEEKRYDVEAVKQRLYEYRERARDIETQSERLERLVSKMEGAGAQIITDMPRAPSSTGDRISALVEQKMELEAAIQEDIDRQKAERAYFEGLIKRLRRSDERSVIRIRYLDCASWNDVVDVLFGGESDYLEKEDVYMQRVHRLHGRALVSMAKYISENEAGRSGTAE